MASSSANKRNVNISITTENADFIRQCNINLSRAVDEMIQELRRKQAREQWLQDNQAALAERRATLELEGGTAAERLYGVRHDREV